MPMLLAITNMILGLQYSWERPWILTQSCVEVWWRFDGIKSLVHGRNLRTPWFRFQEFNDCTRCTSSRIEKKNSKKLLPRDAKPHFSIYLYMELSLGRKQATMRGVKPLSQMVLPWRLYLLLLEFILRYCYFNAFNTRN